MPENFLNNNIKLKNFIKHQLYRKEGQKLFPGLIKDKRKGNEKEKVAFKIGNSTINEPGVLSFNPKEEEENKFLGCIKTEQNAGNYVRINSNNEIDGTDGNELNLNLEITNIIDDEQTNSGVLFKSQSINVDNEILNDIKSHNNIYVKYPYQYFKHININKLSYKKIYFIPNKNNIYEVKVRDTIHDINSNLLWDKYKSISTSLINLNDSLVNNQINFSHSSLQNSSFTYYDSKLKYDNTTQEGDFLTVENEGNMIINNTEDFENNLSSKHNFKKRISFLFSQLEFDDTQSNKNYIVENNNIIINCLNLKKTVDSVVYYFNIQIILALDSNSKSQYLDNDINLKPGTIIFNYGSISPNIDTCLIGLSNQEVGEEINYNTYIEPRWIDINGFGVPPLKANIGLFYNDTNDINSHFQGKINHIFSGRNLGSYSITNYDKDKTFRLEIADNDWGGYYSEKFNGAEYYVKILDIGSILPSRMFLAIQSIFDYSSFKEFNKDNNDFYSSISGTDSNFTGKFNFNDTIDTSGNVTPWENYIFNTNTSIDLTSFTFTDYNWVDVTPNNIQEAKYNSSIYKILIKKYNIGTFGTNGLYTENGSDKYLLKIIYTLKSDIVEASTQDVKVTTNIGGIGPFHINPNYKKVLNIKNNTSFINTSVFNLELEASTNYDLKIVDYKENENRKLYNFELDLIKDDNILKSINSYSSINPILNFTTETDITNYKLLVKNNIKVPYYGIKLEKSTVITDLVLSFTNGTKFEIINSISELELSYIHKEISKLLRKEIYNFEIVNNLTLVGDSIIGTNNYNFKINHNNFNTVLLNSPFTISDFLNILNKQSIYNNVNYVTKFYNNQQQTINLINSGAKTVNFQTLEDLRKDENFLVEEITGIVNNISVSLGSNFTGISDGTYTNVICIGGSGEGLVINYVFSNGAITNITLVDGGKNYKTTDMDISLPDFTNVKFTIGVTSSVNHLDLTSKDNSIVTGIDSIVSNNTQLASNGYNVACTGGSGTGCTVNYFVTNGIIQGVPNVVINNGGIGYVNGETLTISGTDATIVIKTEILKIYYPFDIYKANRKFTDINLLLNDNFKSIGTFQIYKNKYYVDFPFNQTTNEFPANQFSPTELNDDKKLYNVMVIDFRFVIKMSDVGDTNINKITMKIDNTNLKFLIALKDVSNDTANAGDTGTVYISNSNIYVLSDIFDLKQHIEININDNQTSKLELENFGRIFVGFNDENKNTNNNSLEEFNLEVKIGDTTNKYPIYSAIRYKILYP